MDFFGLGGGGLKVSITLNSDPKLKPGIIPLDHPPSWKIRKNPFACLKYPTVPANTGVKQHQVAPSSAPARGGYVSAATNAGDVSYYTRMDVEHGVSPGGRMLKDFAYEADEDVEGHVTLYLPPGKKAEHLGIKIQLIGRIDMSHSIHEGRPHYDFISLSKELAPPGVLYNTSTGIPFHFKNVEKMHETYRGRNVHVRYFIRVQVERKFLPSITKEHDVIVQIRGTEPTVNEPIKMEVGIEDCLHIEFEYEKRCYHLHDVILGKINFLLVKIKIKHMEVAVIRRETCGEGVTAAVIGGGGPPPTSQGLPQPPPPAPGAAADGGGNISTETQTLVKYEIMDGAPVKGETIPVRLYLRGIPADLTPTYDAVNNRFSVRYFLNLVLVDEEDRRYFKQQEIILWRKELG